MQIVHSAITQNKSTRRGDRIVSAHDTDISVIFDYYCNKIRKIIWIDEGTVSKNNRGFININEKQKLLDPCICNSQPADEFIDSACTSAFEEKKRKLKSFVKLQQNSEVQKAFQQLVIYRPKIRGKNPLEKLEALMPVTCLLAKPRSGAN